MSEKQNEPFQLGFNRFLKADFQGSRVTSDGGLLLVRELDERLDGAEDGSRKENCHSENQRIAAKGILNRTRESKMEILAKIPLFSLLFIVGLFCAWATQTTSKAPPKTRVENVTEVIHGVEIADPYRWLEDQDSPETRAWIDAQNSYTQSILGSIPGRDKIRRGLSELMGPGWRYSLTVRKGRYFFTQRLAGQDQDVIYVRTRGKGRDRVLVDPHAWSRDHTASAELLDVSPDGTLIAYGVREGGEDEATVKLLDVAARKELPDRLPRARYRSVSLKADRTGLFYARIGEEGPRLYYHAIGADPVGDQEIFGQGLGREKVLSTSISDDGRYLVILLEHGRGGSARTEIFCRDLQREYPIFPVVKDIDAKFYGAVGGDVLFLRTNWQAPRGRILAVNLNNPAPEHWREVVPQEQAAIEHLYLAGGKLILSYLENAASRVSVFEPDGRHVRDFNLPAVGSAYDISGQWSNDEAFFYFESYNTPTTIYRYRVASGIRQLWWRPDVPVQASKLEVEQVWYRSKDGTRMPMFLLHDKGIRLDRSRPTLLSGYGHFGVSATPAFSAVAVLWTERGGVYAVPNLRGGGEFGEDWHQAGMLEKKQNVFDDFIAAAEWLIQNGYTKPSKLAIIGGSGGGLTVGAAITQRPDLFQAAVCRAALLDMVRYHKFLVGRWWVPEFGSSEDPAQFKFLYAYSPYHRVKPGTKYPAVFLVTGDSDTRVAPLHARKMTALLQATTASDRPVLLRYDAKAGHSGGMSFIKLVEERADQLAFVLWQLGETGPPDQRK